MGRLLPGDSHLGDPPVKFCRAQFNGNGSADLRGAREIPEIREIPALLRLDRLDHAIVARQKNAFAIGLFL